jgi:hypothetical protein
MVRFNDEKVILTKLQGQWIRWDRRISFTIDGQDIKNIKSTDDTSAASFSLDLNPEINLWELSSPLFGDNSALTHVLDNSFTIRLRSDGQIAPKMIEPDDAWKGRVTFDRVDSHNLLQSTVAGYTREEIQKYVDGYVGLWQKAKHDFLQYRMLHDKWKLNKTNEAFEQIIRHKVQYKKAQQEAYESQFPLKDMGLGRWIMGAHRRRNEFEFTWTKSKEFGYSYFPQIRKIFSSYLQYLHLILLNKYLVPATAKEEMKTLLANLPYVLYQNYLPLLIEIWMYYDSPFFMAREILNEQFERNRKVLLPIIRSRIKNRKKWETIDTPPYSDLIALEKKLAAYSK